MSLLRDSFNPHIVSFFETSVLKEVRILRIIYPQCSANNGDVLTPKFQNQANLGGDYMIPVCRDEISTRSAGAYFTQRLHVEIKFHHRKAGQFSTCYLFRFADTFFEFFL